MGNFYNGYSWQQREAILHAQRKLEAAGALDPMSFLNHRCAICDDPNSKCWHSEDYSLPYLFGPPAAYTLCNVCHLRLHKRFASPTEWGVFLIHVRNGGWGREFTARYSLNQRRAWMAQLSAGQSPELPIIRARAITGQEWWQHLTLDPESLTAAWARPRPLLPRPPLEEYRNALAQAKPTTREVKMLVYHANCPNRTTTMRRLAMDVLSSASPSTANAQYGAFAHRLCAHLLWEPEKRDDGSPIWMSVLAEGWQPENREFEWSMIPALAEIYKPPMGSG